MRRSLETEQTQTLDTPLLNVPRSVAEELATRELRAPEIQARQSASIATRNPNAIVALPPTPEMLAVQAQVAAAIRKRREEQQRQRVLEHVFNGDGGPLQWHADVFETFGYALASGMAMGDALRQSCQNAPLELQALFTEIAAQLEQGVTLTQALKAHQEHLPDIVVPIFEHGLIYGTAETAARQTAKALQKLATVEAKFQYSALNPGVVLPLLLSGIMVFGLVAISFVFANPLVPYILFSTVMMGGGILSWKFRHKLAGRRSNHKVLSKMVLQGNKRGYVRRQMGAARWSRTFAALWHCGVPISSALEAAGRTTGNAHYERILCDAAQDLRNGSSLGDSLARVGLLKGEMINTIRTGETTGDLGPILDKWADVLEDDTKERAGQVLFRNTVGLVLVLTLIVSILILMFAGKPI